MSLNRRYTESSSAMMTPSIAMSDDEVESIPSTVNQGSLDGVVPITGNMSQASFTSLSSHISRIPSMARTVTRTINDIREAVNDDNEQTNKKQEGQDLNDILRHRFDVGDALRINSTMQPDVEKNYKETRSTTASTVNSNESFRQKPLTDNSSDKDTDDSDIENPILERVFTNKTTGALELPPDEGYAWIIVFAVFLIMFNTWGCNSSFGVFLSFFLNNDSFEGASRYDYALIAGLTVFLGQGLSPIVMIVMRVFGIKPTMLFGTFLMAAAFILASFSTKLWHLYVTQGFMIGVSISLIFAPATVLLPDWFLKKRAVAMGLSLLGTGAGGVTFGLASNKLISDHGNTQMCYRMLTIVCTCSCIFAICLVKERHPIQPIGIKSLKLIRHEFAKMFAWRVIKQPFVPMVALWFTLALFAYNLMIFTLASYAVARGMSQHNGSTLTAILNGAQCFGRPVMGLLGDRYGRANITIILTTVLTIYMFAFWIPAHTFLQLIFFAIMVGSCVGVANVMNTVLIADMVKPDEFLSAWAFVNYSGAPALLVCEVVAQALTVPSHKTNPYLHTQIFSGCCFFCALLMIFLLREYVVRIKLTKRNEENVKRLEERETGSEAVDFTAGHWELLERRKVKYGMLLGGGIKKYFLRMAYPMKV